MKIGLISDIHGESRSLRIALDLLAKTDIILCAGDLVDKGPDGEGALRIIQRKKIPTVQGNHDESARIMQEFREAIGGIPGDEDWLQPKTIAALEKLPKQLDYTFGEVSLLLTHAAPWPGWDYIWPKSPPEKFRRVAESVTQHIVVMGHTHQPMRVDVGNTTILNPGSVCGAITYGSHTCAILTLPTRKFEVISLADASPAPYEYMAF